MDTKTNKGVGISLTGLESSARHLFVLAALFSAPTMQAFGLDKTTTIRQSDWVLFTATDARGQKIPLFQRDSFLANVSIADNHALFSGRCNRFLAPYTQEEGVLVLGQAYKSSLVCSKKEVANDQSLEALLKGQFKVTFNPDARWPNLNLMQLREASGLELILYRGAERKTGDNFNFVYLEISPQVAQCHVPMLDEPASCMQSRLLQLSENGALKTVGEWQPHYYAISGYRHIEGQRAVLRAKRYLVDTPEIHGAHEIDVLDVLLEISNDDDARKSP